MACIGTTQPPCGLEWGRADFDGFWDFIGPWLHRVRRGGARRRDDPFPDLIYLWVAFNAWLGQVVGDRAHIDRDWTLVLAAAHDPKLTRAFEETRAAALPAGRACVEFHALWPVFKARALVDRNILPWEAPSGTEGRSTFRAACFASHLDQGDWAPRCFQAHQPSGTSPAQYDPGHVPLDWPHMIAAIYQVRCNLFHGGKTFVYAGDRMFVALAVDILREVWARSGAIPRHIL
ncbi:MAG: hypothetical protein Q8P50_11950 [Bacillota bacterium]|nr:hypothetical protein [Bacillota bacterium]